MGRARSQSVEGVVGMVRQFSWPVARREEEEEEEEIIYEMVASLRPLRPCVRPLKKGRGREGR